MVSPLGFGIPVVPEMNQKMKVKTTITWEKILPMYKFTCVYPVVILHQFRRSLNDIQNDTSSDGKKFKITEKENQQWYVETRKFTKSFGGWKGSIDKLNLLG